MLEHSPLLSALYNHAVHDGDKVALVGTNQNITYYDLWKRILQAASYLRSTGLEKGDRIILSGNKDVEFVYLYFASHLLGVQNVVIDPMAEKERREYIASLTHPRMVFGFEEASTRSINYSELFLENFETLECWPMGLSLFDTADIMFTTGTTAKPKGVMLSNYNIYSSANNINTFIGNTKEDVEVLGLPICHSFGLGRLRCTMLTGGTLVLLGSFANVAKFFNVIETYKVSGFGIVPAMWSYIKRISGNRIGQYADYIKYIEIGSAAMDVGDKRLLMELFPNTRICMHYGLTEASRSLFMEFHENKNNLTTIGKPVSNQVSVKIISETGHNVPVGQEGEICVSGNMVANSYLLPEDNKSAFWGKYFRTGDWGYMDSNGDFYMLSRKKELINVGGKKVNPIEVEEAIMSLGFADCACVGVHHDILGEVPKAFIVQGKSEMTFEDIRKSLKTKLEAYKIPVMFEWIDVVPRTTSGKKRRLSLVK